MAEKLVVAPGIPASELEALRKHIEEAKNDPDYAICWSYQADWNLPAADDPKQN